MLRRNYYCGETPPIRFWPCYGAPMTLPLIAAAVGVVLVSNVATAAAQTTVRVSRADCARLVEYKQPPGVAYKPGVDVRGNAVAPADLPGSNRSIVLPEHVEFDLSFNPLRGNLANRFERTELPVGRIGFNLETGEATFNGQPLTSPQQAELSRKCQRALGKGR